MSHPGAAGTGAVEIGSGRVTERDAFPFHDPCPVEGHPPDRTYSAGARRRASIDVDAGHVSRPPYRGAGCDRCQGGRRVLPRAPRLPIPDRRRATAAGAARPTAGRTALVLRDSTGEARLAVQHVAELPTSDVARSAGAPTAPPRHDGRRRRRARPQRDRALALGATVLLDRFTDPDEPLYVFADPPAIRSASSCHRTIRASARRGAGRVLVRNTSSSRRVPMCLDGRVDRRVRTIAGDVDRPAGEDVSDPVELHGHPEEVDDVGLARDRSGRCRRRARPTARHRHAGAPPRAGRERTRCRRTRSRRSLTRLRAAVRVADECGAQAPVRPCGDVRQNSTSRARAGGSILGEAREQRTKEPRIRPPERP